MTPAPPADCNRNTDPLKLVRQGTSQDQRLSPALDPVYAPVNEHTHWHWMVFAQTYSAFLKYYNSANVPAGDWQPFFSEDVSAQLAVAAVQEVEFYRQRVREFVDFLNDRQNRFNEDGLRDHLDFLFSCCATLAIRLNQLTERLPEEIALKKSLQNLVKQQLAPALKRLIRYHLAGQSFADNQKPLNGGNAEKAAPLEILGGAAVKFSALSAAGLSQDWTDGSDWSAYYTDITADISGEIPIYGTGTTVFERVNHLATHNLFTSILDQFLKVYARAVSEAKPALAATLTAWNRHEPHYALFLAFLRLFEYARAEANTLTGRHLDFYYRQILRLKEKSAEPGKAHLLVELARQAPAHLIKAGELFKAGKDDRGSEAFFANDRDLVANQAKVAALKNVYRHGEEEVGYPTSSDRHQGRFFASPVANSEDGLGAPLTSVDESWHPFFHKRYQDGVLAEIMMSEAEVGFALASHHLFLAEGERTVTLGMTITGSTAALLSPEDYRDEITCLFSAAEGWVEGVLQNFSRTENSKLELKVKLSGGEPAVTPYNAKVHGYSFGVNLPMLLVKIKHTDGKYIYNLFQDTEVANLVLTTEVSGLKTLAVSNDFGPVDTSKPFLPFGASAIKGSALLIGSRELFQKTGAAFELTIKWQVRGTVFPNTAAAPGVTATWLKDGDWGNGEPITLFSSDEVTVPFSNFENTVLDEPDLSENAFFSTDSRRGFVHLALDGDFGQAAYQTELRKFLTKQITTDPGAAPTIPIIESLFVKTYKATQTIALNSALPDDYEKRKARFFHLGPFGQAEQHPFLSSASKVYLFPQFDFQSNNIKQESEAELYLGVTGLQPPQNLAVLFQVADGTADPQSAKPDPHLHWSYLRGNEWMPFAKNEVADQTGGLLNSGIITFSVPREASAANTLLPAGMHWLRAAAASESDAVCRLRMVAAQALAATFRDRGNDPAFPAKVLPAGTISKLDQPDAAVKKIVQPFPSFGGRGKEAPTVFYTRVSERLRHKDRAIALWDYERLVLEAFPQIYQVKCLNHTQYEPAQGIYKELAPGHVTLVPIPNQQFSNLRDPLRPLTSLGLLKQIGAFLRPRLSCFVALHVENPQFEEVWGDFKVRWAEGADESFHLNKLREDLTRFLSPWAFPGGGHPSFGGKIYKSVLINFVEEQPYVDYVSDFKLFQNVEGVPATTDQNEVEGSKAISILVSVPPRKHVIETIKDVGEEKPGEKCPCEA